MSNYPSQAWSQPWSLHRPAPWITVPDSPEIPLAQLRPQGHSRSEEFGATYESMLVDGSEVRFDTSMAFFTVIDASWPSSA